MNAWVNRIGEWFDERFHLKPLIEENVTKKLVPCTLSWAGCFGGLAFLCFLVQVVTGMLLLMYYKPTPDAAWDSVTFVKSNVPMGWLVQRIHAVTANVMIVLVAMHMARVAYYKIYRKPRELHWISGVVLFSMTLGLAFTGYLLPWTQLSYWGAKVGTEIPGGVPVIGAAIVEWLRRGENITGETLGFFFAMHIWVLPAVISLFMTLHFLMIRPRESHVHFEHRKRALAMGVDYRKQYEPHQLEPFWPNEILKMTVAVLCTLAIIMGLVILPVVLDAVGLGGMLHEEEPADPFGPTPLGIKPEWYFLASYQYLRIMPTELIGISGKTLGVITQGVVILPVALLPFLYRRKAAQAPGRLYRTIITALIVASLALTVWGGWPETHGDGGEHLAPLTEYVRHRPLFFLMIGISLTVFYALIARERHTIRRTLGPPRLAEDPGDPGSPGELPSASPEEER